MIKNELEKRLNKHINAEKSREFKTEHWLKSRDFLANLSQQEWLKNTAKVIHIVGSNGKGSVAHYLNELARSIPECKNIGLYTSPHLISTTERIKINSKAISIQEALHGLNSIEKNLGSTRFIELSWFEVLTILALYTFKQNNCQLIILEAGLGGRLDATRMAAGENIVLTQLSLEHTNILGTNIQEIANEKLGIITSKSRCIFIKEDVNISSYSNLIQNSMKGYLSKSLSTNTTTHPKVIPFNVPQKINYLEESFSYAQFILENIYKKEFTYSDFKNIQQPPGRMEIRKIDTSTLLFDTAHNPGALTRVLNDLQKLSSFPGKNNCLLLLGVLKDKELNLCTDTITECGFTKITFIVDDSYAKPESPDLPTVEKKQLIHFFNHMQSQKKIPKWIVFLGSHRHYPEFMLLTQFLGRSK